MSDLPPLALSVRQPWAWAIICAGKDIENRGPLAIRKGGMRPQRIAIHAAKTMTQAQYDGARRFIEDITGALPVPAPADLLRGGIVGAVTVLGISTKSASRWFTGPRGLLLANPQPCEFIPASGRLGFFKWERADDASVPAPAKWMRAKIGAPLLEEAFL